MQELGFAHSDLTVNIVHCAAEVICTLQYENESPKALAPLFEFPLVANRQVCEFQYLIRAPAKKEGDGEEKKGKDDDDDDEEEEVELEMVAKADAVLTEVDSEVMKFSKKRMLEKYKEQLTSGFNVFLCQLPEVPPEGICIIRMTYVEEVPHNFDTGVTLQVPKMLCATESIHVAASLTMPFDIEKIAIHPSAFAPKEKEKKEKTEGDDDEEEEDEESTVEVEGKTATVELKSVEHLLSKGDGTLLQVTLKEMKPYVWIEQLDEEEYGVMAAWFEAKNYSVEREEEQTLDWNNLTTEGFPKLMGGQSPFYTLLKEIPSEGDVVGECHFLAKNDKDILHQVPLYRKDMSSNKQTIHRLATRDLVKAGERFFTKAQMVEMEEKYSVDVSQYTTFVLYDTLHGNQRLDTVAVIRGVDGLLETDLEESFQFRRKNRVYSKAGGTLDPTRQKDKDSVPKVHKDLELREGARVSEMLGTAPKQKALTLNDMRKLRGEKELSEEEMEKEKERLKKKKEEMEEKERLEKERKEKEAHVQLRPVSKSVAERKKSEKDLSSDEKRKQEDERRAREAEERRLQEEKEKQEEEEKLRKEEEERKAKEAQATPAPASTTPQTTSTSGGGSAPAEKKKGGCCTVQ